MSISDELGEFTPVSHSLARELGVICALVYGAIWRYSKMDDGICYASLGTIAGDLHIDRTTVLRAIRKLSANGYVTDQTPGRRNSTHKYSIIKTVVQCNTNCCTEQQLDQNCCTVQHKLLHRTTVCSQTVAQSHMNKNKKRDSNRVRDLEEPKPGPLSQALLGICQLDWNYVKTDDKLRKTFFSILKFLDSSNVIPSELKKFEEWRVANHWTGKNAPTLKQVGELWGQYKQNGNGASVIKIGAK